LTDDVADDAFPDLSPDGSTVVWDSTRDGGRKAIYAMDLATGSVRALTSTAESEASAAPAWSPDGKRIAFLSLPEAGTDWVLSVMNDDGSRVRRVAQVRSDDPLRPTWSPDGKRLAFASLSKGSKGTLHISVVNVDGSGRRQLTRGNGEYEPNWSPVGNVIAYFAKQGVWVMGADGSEARRITTGNLSAFQPTWSPDGTQIAYVNEAPGHTEIFVVAAGGKRARPHRVTTALGHQSDEAPSWSAAPTAAVTGEGGARAEDAVALVGVYDIHLAPIPGACTGLENCDAIEPVEFEAEIIDTPGPGHSIVVGGYEAPLTYQAGEYVSGGSLGEDLITQTCDGQSAPTNYEMRFTVSVTASRTPRGGGRTAERAQELQGSYNEVAPAFAGCGESSKAYTLTGTRAS
jgi:TolB protein